MKRLTLQAFLDRYHETNQAVIMARPGKLVDALANAIESETEKQLSSKA